MATNFKYSHGLKIILKCDHVNRCIYEPACLTTLAPQVDKHTFSSEFTAFINAG